MRTLSLIKLLYFVLVMTGCILCSACSTQPKGTIGETREQTDERYGEPTQINQLNRWYSKAGFLVIVSYDEASGRCDNVVYEVEVDDAHIDQALQQELVEKNVGPINDTITSYNLTYYLAENGHGVYDTSTKKLVIDTEILIDETKEL